MLMEVTAEEREALEMQRRQVTTEELALVLGISERRIQQLAKENVLERRGRGLFNLCDSVQDYIAYKRGETVARSIESLDIDDSFLDDLDVSWLDSAIEEITAEEG